jgi:5'-nucleotidase
MTDEIKIENIALFDMDGTLCDYDKALAKSLEILRSPDEEDFNSPIRDNSPKYLKNRADLIRTSVEWWATLPKFKLGFEIWELAEKLGYRKVILTQGPRKNAAGWQGKKIWIDKNIGEDTDIIITRDKGLVYGRILVDDFPGYIEKWLKHRPRGLVIMPASAENITFKHPQVIRYDGTNLEQVKRAMKDALR